MGNNYSYYDDIDIPAFKKILDDRWCNPDKEFLIYLIQSKNVHSFEMFKIYVNEYSVKPDYRILDAAAFHLRLDIFKYCLPSDCHMTRNTMKKLINNDNDDTIIEIFKIYYRTWKNIT